MSAQKAFSVGGFGAAPGLEDVVRVAAGLQVQVALDTAGAERIKKESPSPKSFEQEGDLPLTAVNGEPLAPSHARAVLFTRLLSIMNGKSGVRLQVAEFLKQLLNGGGALPLRAGTEREILHALADACKGAGDGVGPALAAAGVDAPPSLSAAERAVLTSGAPAAGGIGALAVTYGRGALAAASAVAALSCEAYGAASKPFDADIVEAGGHKAAAAAADQLRGLLDGSKCVGTRKGATTQQMALFSGLPQVRGWRGGRGRLGVARGERVGGALAWSRDSSAAEEACCRLTRERALHGAARHHRAQLLGSASDALAAAYAAVRSEVQSGAVAPVKGGAPAAASPLLASTLADAARALLAVAASSLARAALVAEAAAPAPVPAVAALAAGVADGPLAAARRQVADVQAALLEASVSPGAAGKGAAGQQGPLAALAADAAAAVAVEALAVEALAALAALRIQQVRGALGAAAWRWGEFLVRAAAVVKSSDAAALAT